MGLLVYTREDVARLGKVWGGLISTIEREGRVLYVR